VSFINRVLKDLFAWTVLGSLVATSDAAATAHNILAYETLYRLCKAADLLTVPCYIAVTALFYQLFQLVNRRLASSPRSSAWRVLRCRLWTPAFFSLPWSSWEARTPYPWVRQVNCGGWRSCFSMGPLGKGTDAMMRQPAKLMAERRLDFLLFL